MQIVSGELTPDAGTVWRDTGVQVARLVQDVPLDTHDSVGPALAALLARRDMLMRGGGS
jgi:ATPase subunit of ABC transporter with duplicated ATPase domains